MSTYIHMMVEGSALPGQPDRPDMGGINLVEHTRVLSMYYDYSVPGADMGSIRQSNRTEMSPITIVKTVDLISPMLQEALSRNDRVDALIRIFDSSPDDGAAFQAHKFTLLQARITGIRVELPTHGGGSLQQPLERISLAPATLTNESLRGSGSEATWAWDAQL